MGGEELEELGYRGFGAGLLVEEEFALDPEKLYNSMKGLLENYGVKFVDDRVLRVSEDGRVRLSLAKTGTLEAGYAVIACGSWVGELTKPLGYDPEVEPARGLVAKFPLKETIVKGPGLLEDYGIAVQQHPSTGTLRVTGFFELLGFNESWTRGRVEWLIENVRRHLRGLEGVRVEGFELSTGFRPCTPTMTPIIGFIPGSGRILVASGHCRLGLTLAPATGELVRDFIEGSKPKLSQEAVRELKPK
ncbi:MAG: FAD-binding oxidoreductase [Thermoprotei archaeon]|nr:FAD-binding oxidoreductase [Thermoprotei archaeon]